MATNSAYGASARETCELYADFFQGDAGKPALVLSTRGAGDASMNAIVKSLKSFGYPEDPCSFATLYPHDPSSEGGDIMLDAQALFLLIEGIDPLNVIVTDKDAAIVLAQAYRTQFGLDSPMRVFGRSSVAFADLESLLQTSEGKQKAWRVFKSLQSS